jgi:hypothetical protein
MVWKLASLPDIEPRPLRRPFHRLLCRVVELFGAAERTLVIAKLAWGFFHGLGMGAGLGFAFYQVQKLIRSEAPKTDSVPA